MQAFPASLTPIEPNILAPPFAPSSAPCYQPNMHLRRLSCIRSRNLSLFTTKTPFFIGVACTANNHRAPRARCVASPRCRLCSASVGIMAPNATCRYIACYMLLLFLLLLYTSMPILLMRRPSFMPQSTRTFRDWLLCVYCGCAFRFSCRCCWLCCCTKYATRRFSPPLRATLLLLLAFIHSFCHICCYCCRKFIHATAGQLAAFCCLIFVLHFLRHEN